MANHVRQQLREAVATAVTGLTTTGTRVFQSRVYPLDMLISGGPGLRISTPGDVALLGSIHAPPIYDRATEIIVEGCAKASIDIDDVVDTVCKEVEVALASGVTVAGKLVPMEYQGVEIELDGEGDKTVAVARMRFQCQLFTAANAPDALL